MRRHELIIFDNDGVLVDSEPLSNRILAAYLTELGHPTSYEDSVRDYMGAAVHRIHDTVLERTGRRLPDDFDDVFHARVFEAFRRELQAVAGVEDVLKGLRAEGIPYCLASSGSRERIRVALAKTGLAVYFEDDRIFSAHDVDRGKPAPDLFLYAAACCGTEPSRCAVIEDSPLGVEAAVAAGMEVYGFAAMTPAGKLSAADGVFREMDALGGLLRG